MKTKYIYYFIAGILIVVKYFFWDIFNQTAKIIHMILEGFCLLIILYIERIYIIAFFKSFVSNNKNKND